MWLFFAFGSALFSAITAIFAKVGVKNMDSHLATALRTIVVALFTWLMVLVVGSQGTVGTIPARSLVFLFLSGISTGASWLCYFKALQMGDVNKVTPVDKSSTMLTILLAFLFLGERPTVAMCIGIVLLGVGTWLMIRRGENAQPQGKGVRSAWLLPAVLSAVFAALTSILGKIGIQEVESNLGTALRTIVVLVMAWGIVFAQGKHREIRSIDRKSWGFLILSGVATGLAWLCFYRALQEGNASVVVPIDKLSVVGTILFSRLFLGERLTRQAAVGLVLVVGGSLLLLF